MRIIYSWVTILALMSFLVTINLFCQYRLWFTAGSITANQVIRHEIDQIKQQNLQMMQTNQRLLRHLQELKNSPELLAAQARCSLNLLESKEILVIFNSKQQAACMH